jgi:hypothetical protein
MLYNDNVMRWAGPFCDSYEEYDDLVIDFNDVEDEVYDDSKEWYNIYGAEADG